MPIYKFTPKTNKLKEEIQRLRQAGLSDAQIGRQLGFSKQLTGQVAGTRRSSAEVALVRTEKGKSLCESIAAAKHEIFLETDYCDHNHR